MKPEGIGDVLEHAYKLAQQKHGAELRTCRVELTSASVRAVPADENEKWTAVVGPYFATAKTPEDAASRLAELLEGVAR